MDCAFWDKVKKTDGCWIWTAYRNPCGYGQVRYLGRTRLSHRVVWMIANGAIPKGMNVLHKCDVPACVNPDHLRLGTQRDNIHDMLLKKRESRGEKHGLATKLKIPRGDNHYYKRHPERIKRGITIGTSKLTESQVIEIREKYRKGVVTQLSLGKLYGIDQSVISDIVRRRIWTHL